jgi:hypothetical protein
MKYKHLLLAIMSAAISVTTVSAQEHSSGFSIKVYGGYGLFTPGADYSIDYTNDVNYAYKKNTFGYGQGTHFGGGLALKLNDKISIGLDADYLTGNKSFNYSMSSDTLSGAYTYKHSVFSLIPNISFDLWTTPGYRVYNRMGIILALQTKITQNGNLTDTSPQGTSSETFDYKFDLNAGFNDAFGIAFPVTKKLKLFGEINGYYLGLNTSSSSNVNIGNYGGQSSVTTINTVYKGGTNVTYIATYSANGNQAVVNDTAPPFHQRVFAIGLNAGIIYSLK